MSSRKSCFIRTELAKLEDKYEIQSKLGEGSYGSVYLVREVTSNELRAAKQVCKTNLEHPERLDREIEVMRSADHPHIMRLFEIIEDRRFKYLIIDHCSGGELFDYIFSQGFLSEAEAAVFFQQIIRAVSYLHSKNICHRDLKPENLMLSDNASKSLKLADFGLSRVSTSSMKTRSGTPFYISPEVLMGKYSKKTDIWSAGVILYIMLCGYPPFYSEDTNKIFEKILVGNYSFKGKEWRRVSPSAKDLVRSMLVMDPDLRATAGELLKHPWVQYHSENREVVLNSKAIQEYSLANRVIKKMLLCIAAQCSETEIAKISLAFLQLDTEGKGRVRADALGKFRAFDNRNRGMVGFNEFVAANLGPEIVKNASKIKSAFDIIDTEQNGVISINGLAFKFDDIFDMLMI